MKSQDPLENAFAILARDPATPPDPADFQTAVWREIRHREALRAHTTESHQWWMAFDCGKAAALAACLALLIGISLGVTYSPAPKETSLASRYLDLGVFSTSASGLPSNALASRK